MAGTIIADRIEAASTSQMVIENGVANTPPTIVDVNNTQVGTFCRAWVNFNGTGTVAIRASFNVSSITDNGTGDYTVNFTNAMPDANYAAVTMTKSTSSSGYLSYVKEGTYSTYVTTTSIRFTTSSTSAFGDTEMANIAIFR